MYLDQPFPERASSQLARFLLSGARRGRDRVSGGILAAGVQFT